MPKNLFIVDDEDSPLHDRLNAISFSVYLRDYPKLNERNVRIINLCDTERYLSQGYYCSLLAEARQHQVLPTVKTINALRGDSASLWYSKPLPGYELPQEGLTRTVVCMGETRLEQLNKLASWVFMQCPAPIMIMDLYRDVAGIRIQVKRVALSDLAEPDHAFCVQTLEAFSLKSWHSRGKQTKTRWELAMLVDHTEAQPPSNKVALKRFIKAGQKLGIRVQMVEASELKYLNQYDALFIRETTAINHHTYRLAREAEKQGLVVIDDPDSILRCCNKVFLHDAFDYRKVPSLKTHIIRDIGEETLAFIESEFSYPLILKMPEGSFSKGVFKAKDREQLKDIAGSLLQDSALVLAQEYLFTEYDWRIGVLNGRALYACRYYMATGHWQIYNHGSSRNFSGGFDAMPTFEVPRKVLDAALKAAAVVGNGLYGIDIKTVNGKPYVLEVNDNPSIDCGVEDKYLGEELYMQVMAEFLRRLELRGR